MAVVLTLEPKWLRKINDFRSYPPPKKPKSPFDCTGAFQRLPESAGALGRGFWTSISAPTRTEPHRRSNVRAVHSPSSADLKGPRKLFRIRSEIFDFELDLGLKLGQTKHKIPGTVPTDRHTTIPKDSGPIPADPKLLNCEIAQPSPGRPRNNKND